MSSQYKVGVFELASFLSKVFILVLLRSLRIKVLRMEHTLKAMYSQHQAFKRAKIIKFISSTENEWTENTKNLKRIHTIGLLKLHSIPLIRLHFMLKHLKKTTPV